jgi:hypothetical protein
MRISNHSLLPKFTPAIFFAIIFSLSAYGFPSDGTGTGSGVATPETDPEELLAYLVTSTKLVSVLLISLFSFALFYRLLRKGILGNPETLLLRIADCLPKKQRKILHQEAVDLKEEYDEAILFGKIVRAIIIVISYHFGVGWSVFIWIADQIKRIIKISKK